MCFSFLDADASCRAQASAIPGAILIPGAIFPSEDPNRGAPIAIATTTRGHALYFKIFVRTQTSHCSGRESQIRPPGLRSAEYDKMPKSRRRLAPPRTAANRSPGVMPMDVGGGFANSFRLLRQCPKGR